MAPGAPRLILASGSAGRRGLLEAAGIPFEARPAGVDEHALRALAAGEDAAGMALMLARAKAAQVARMEPGALVVGADQILVCEDRRFDKPADRAAAAAQLRALRGRAHELVTAVTCYENGTEAWCHVTCPTLVMRAFSDAFLEAYLAGEGDAILGCAGAYRVEALGIHLFERIEGEFSAILGLPMLGLLAFLRERGALLS